LASKKNSLARYEKMAKNSVASQEELREAQLAAALAEIKVQQAQQEQQQKKLQADRQKIKVDLMHLKSPIDGLVEKLNLGLGEVVDPNKPSCTVVKNDPLWVEIHLPSRQAAELGMGDTLPVQEDGKKLWADAKVIFLSPVADAASGTRLVRLAMPNPTGVPSGLQVSVKLPEKLLSASATTDAR
jgi:multidrug resistance efflux pump